MIVEILEILTRGGVIEPLTLTTIFSFLVHGYFRFKAKKIELQKLKIELLKSQSDIEIKQRLENLEGIITSINQGVKNIDAKPTASFGEKQGKETPSKLVEK